MEPLKGSKIATFTGGKLSNWLGTVGFWDGSCADPIGSDGVPQGSVPDERGVQAANKNTAKRQVISGVNRMFVMVIFVKPDSVNKLCLIFPVTLHKK